MKKLVLLSVMLMALGVTTLAQATLIDRGADSLGNHLIYDSDLNITWYDYTKSGDSWQNQMNWAANLTVNFNGTTLDGWRMPTTMDDSLTMGNVNHDPSKSEMLHLINTELGIGTPCLNNVCGWNTVVSNAQPFTDLLYAHYWIGTEFAADANTVVNGTVWPDAWVTIVGMSGNWEHSDISFEGYDALAVMDGDVKTVPESSTMLLLASSLIGLWGFRKVKRSN